MLGSAGVAAHGFVINARADDRFHELERLCQADHAVCRDRLPDGRYRSATMESMYQEVLDFDRRARRGLLAGQIGLGAALVLFILDLGNERPPEDIPYAPGKLQVLPNQDGSLLIRVRME